MDEFEKNYFAKLKKLAIDYQSQRNELAHARIKIFTAAVCRQLLEQDEKFDLIVASGNSGLFMMEIVKIIYKELKIELPQTLTIPVYRYKEVDGKIVTDDNTRLQEYVTNNIQTAATNLNVLFVDDETMTGLTIKTSLKLLLYALPDLTKLRCVVISEHHFFEWHFNLPKVSINYFAYARLIHGLNGNIGYFIPENLYAEIKSHIPDVESHNHAMAIVIGGALKRKDADEIPFYDSSVTEILKNSLPDYEQTKNALLHQLSTLVTQGIHEYKQKIITFRF